jgi:hypothetical protein
MKNTFLIFLTVFIMASYGLARAGTMTLLTEKEGAMEEAPAGLIEIGRTINDGPEIKIIKPAIDNDYKSPVEIDVLFIPLEGVGVDLSQLKVECLKIITIDLTNRILPYSTDGGIKIENADLPKGKHKIRVTIGDMEGGVTQEVFLVKVQ